MFTKSRTEVFILLKRIFKSFLYIQPFLKIFERASNKNVFQKELVIIKTLHEIAGREFDVVEFGKIKNMRLHQNGGGNIEFLADLRQVIEKVGVGQLLRFFVHKLLLNFPVLYEFRPNFHIRLLSFFLVRRCILTEFVLFA